MITNAKNLYNTKYGKTYLNMFPGALILENGNSFSVWLRPKSCFVHVQGTFRQLLMRIVPNEIPTKCDFFISRKSKTSRISLAKAEKVFLFESRFKVVLESP
jgi:hypothetical protein